MHQRLCCYVEPIQYKSPSVVWSVVQRFGWMARLVGWLYPPVGSSFMSSRIVFIFLLLFCLSFLFFVFSFSKCHKHYITIENERHERESKQTYDMGNNILKANKPKQNKKWNTIQHYKEIWNWWYLFGSNSCTRKKRIFPNNKRIHRPVIPSPSLFTTEIWWKSIVIKLLYVHMSLKFCNESFLLRIW